MKPSRDRVLGALMGVHVGDCLGSGFEFDSWAQVRANPRLGERDLVGGGAFRWKPGQPTDDTDLTRAVLLGYLDRHRHYSSGPSSARDFDVATAAGKRMLDWLFGEWPGRKKGSRPVDIGAATSVGLDKFASCNEVKDDRPTGGGDSSAGNGSLMRCIPSALFDDSLSVAIRNARRIGAITHAGTPCVAAVSTYIAIAWHLVRGSTVPDALEAGLVIAASFPQVYAAVRDAMPGGITNLRRIADSGPAPENGIAGHAKGWVIESLKLGVAALVDGRGAEEVLVDVVRVGKDTDTNAAIAGGLLGARDGMAGIPKRWAEKCWFADEFALIVDEILEGTLAC